MANIKVFESKEFGKIRVVIIDGEPWFGGKDVADSLGYSNTKDAIISHVDEADRRIIQRSEIATFENNLPKDAFPISFVAAEIPNRGITVINESGLYALIFGSKLAVARRFKRWVTSDVIPSIRQHGAYMTTDTAERMINDPDFAIRLLTELKTERAEKQRIEAERLALAAENEVMQPKADCYDNLVSTDALYGIRETGKMIGLPQNVFVSLLSDKRFICRDSRGKIYPSSTLNLDYFRYRTFPAQDNGYVGKQLYFTIKGVDYFRRLFAPVIEDFRT